MNRLELRNQPAYTLAESARYVKMSGATLRSWVLGRTYPKAGGMAQFEPLIHPPVANPPQLSFWNLVEAHVLRSLRTDHGVAMSAMRDSIAFAESELGIDRLLLSQDLCTHGGEVLLERYGELIHLSRSGQITMKRMLKDHLARVDWDDLKCPVRLHPFPMQGTHITDRPIAIDPAIAFGRPVLVRRSVSTGVIAERIDAGEPIEAVAEDYDISVEEAELAVVYERAA